MPSSLTDSLIRGSPEPSNHLNEKKRAINTFPGLPLSICHCTGEKKKKGKSKDDNGSFLQKTLDSECGLQPVHQKHPSLPLPKMKSP